MGTEVGECWPLQDYVGHITISIRTSMVLLRRSNPPRVSQIEPSDEDSERIPADAADCSVYS